MNPSILNQLKNYQLSFQSPIIEFISYLSKTLIWETSYFSYGKCLVKPYLKEKALRKVKAVSLASLKNDNFIDVIILYFLMESFRVCYTHNSSKLFKRKCFLNAFHQRKHSFLFIRHSYHLNSNRQTLTSLSILDESFC